MGAIYDILKKANGKVDDKVIGKVKAQIKTRPAATQTAGLEALVQDGPSELTGFQEVDQAAFDGTITPEQREAIAKAVLAG